MWEIKKGPIVGEMPVSWAKLRENTRKYNSHVLARDLIIRLLEHLRTHNGPWKYRVYVLRENGHALPRVWFVIETLVSVDSMVWLRSRCQPL